MNHEFGFTNLPVDLQHVRFYRRDNTAQQSETLDRLSRLAVISRRNPALRLARTRRRHMRFHKRVIINGQLLEHRSFHPMLSIASDVSGFRFFHDK